MQGVSPPAPRKRRIPWDAIRGDYIHGVEGRRGERRYPSHRELARTHGCSDSQVSRRAMREGWIAKREAFVMRTVEARSRHLAEDLAAKAAAADLAFYQLSMATMQQVALRLREAQESGFAIPPATVKELSVAIQNLQHTIRLSLGQETSSARHDADLTFVDYVRMIDADRGPALPAPAPASERRQKAGKARAKRSTTGVQTRDPFPDAVNSSDRA